MEWMLLPFRRYADFSGRSRRMEYWMYQVFTLLVYAACFAVMLAGLPWGEMVAAGQKGGASSPPGPLFFVGLALVMVWYLVTFIPDIAVTVRRFHDQNLSGWFYLLRFIPSVGWIAVMAFMFIDGNRGENRFGQDSKAERMGDVFA